MMEKLKCLRIKKDGPYPTHDAVEKFNRIIVKLNDLIDVVNTIQKEREAEWFEIQEWIGILEAVRKSVNIHEKQIDDLQMKLAQDDFDNAILGALKDKKVDVVVEPADRMIGSVSFDKIEGTMNPEPDDPYAEQKRWIGCICRFWNDESLEDSMYGELVNIADVSHEECPFQCGYGEWYSYCEPVKPDDPIIYKGE